MVLLTLCRGESHCTERNDYKVGNLRSGQGKETQLFCFCRGIGNPKPTKLFVNTRNLSPSEAD